ncbi:NF-X1-type zinc finger protein NFXL1 [Elysia marginata]|uniref:NF-X1-type zinc finger protein NFXL1 n=1 Tax=Elysia marginata TaxID=1093978 RepID=A0AAV4HL24_9GAST|nr:NF-X1-type zinc finger protein NFXL1 [Elysia marginata]
MNGQPAYLRGRGRGRGLASQTHRQDPTPRLIQNGAASQNQPRRPGPLQPVSSPWSNANGNQPSINGSSLRSPSKDSQHLETSLKSVKDLFAQARQDHLESAKKHLESKEGGDLDDSEDEEDDIGSIVLNGVFKSYAKTYDENGTSEVHSAQEKLLHSFRSGTSACLVCIETIKKDDAIWSCSGCYCMFHITCIQKWVREGVYQKQYSSGELNADEKNTQNIPWFCPKCRHEYSQSQCPTRYYCFCGKEQDPKFDPWLVPHSCGAVCGRKLKPDCSHTCLLLCHPGPCPPCPAMVKSTCYCGKSAPRIVRCSARSWACNKVCGKTLSCGLHKCADKCHAGECRPCAKTSIQQCCCGKNKSERPCDSMVWKCDKMCGKILSCGNHRCEQICHTGTCGPCPRSGLRKCPCGKAEYQLPCTEDILTCGDTCGKALSCGEHFCAQRCHTGDCGQCCDGNCPGCEQICGKTLRCRNHKCASRCHKGPCYPCPLTVEITCFCKKTKISVPCGRERDTKPPRCNQLCRAPSECHHPQRQKHRCHFGECPPCSFVCNLSLEGCQHKCPVKCHDSVRTKIEDKSVKIGPWDARPIRFEKVKKPCPPCQVPVSVQCMGLHEAGVECQPCELGCEAERPPGCNHKCPKPCHPAPCPPCRMMVRMRCHCQTLLKHIECNKWVAASAQLKETLQSCGQPCPKEMPCGHPCGAICHPGSCPNTGKCEKKVVLKCKCKRKKKEIICKDRPASQGKLECDENCKSNKKNVDELKQKEAEEEERRRQEAELEEFERMMKGRKKKPRKHREAEVQEEGFCSKYHFYVMFLAVGLTSAAAGVFLYGEYGG